MTIHNQDDFISKMLRRDDLILKDVEPRLVDVYVSIRRMIKAAPPDIRDAFEKAGDEVLEYALRRFLPDEDLRR